MYRKSLTTPWANVAQRAEVFASVFAVPAFDEKGACSTSGAHVHGDGYSCANSGMLLCILAPLKGSVH